MRMLTFSELIEYSRLIDAVGVGEAERRIFKGCFDGLKTYDVLYKSYNKLELWQKRYLINIDGSGL